MEMRYGHISIEHDGVRYRRVVSTVSYFTYDGFEFFIYKTKNGYIGTEAISGFATTLNLSVKNGNTYCPTKEEAKNRTIKNIEHAKSKGKSMKFLVDKAIKQWSAIPQKQTIYNKLKKINKI